MVFKCDVIGNHILKYHEGKQSFAKRLNEKLTEEGYPERGRANRILEKLTDKVSLITIRNWLNGEHLPELKRIRDLAMIAGTTAEYLLTGTETENYAAPVPTYRQVPLLSHKSIGKLVEEGRSASAVDTEEWIPSPSKVSVKGYATKVTDQSMIGTHPTDRSYLPGTTLFIDPEIDLQTGQRIVAVVNGQVIFRVYINDAGAERLVPLNAQFKSVDLTHAECFVAGVVVGSYLPEDV